MMERPYGDAMRRCTINMSEETYDLLVKRAQLNGRSLSREMHQTIINSLDTEKTLKFDQLETVIRSQRALLEALEELRS